ARVARACASVAQILGFAVPAWNPLNWNAGWITQVLGELAPGGIYWDVAVRTIKHVESARDGRAALARVADVTALAGSGRPAPPAPSSLARHPAGTKPLLLLLLTLPFWISYL